MTDVVDEEAWLLASAPQKPSRRGRGALALVAGVLTTSLALVAVRGASRPSAPRPAGRLYYAAGQTFAELETSLAEFEKEWHNAFPEELVAQCGVRDVRELGKALGVGSRILGVQLREVGLPAAAVPGRWACAAHDRRRHDKFARAL